MFEGTGHAMAQSWGVPEYRFLALPHPIANLTDADLDARARAIAPQVVSLLLKGQEG
ncbi:MAG: UGSC family (seleno)protein [Candidatus Rokuibacteriota bacterium]